MRTVLLVISVFCFLQAAAQTPREVKVGLFVNNQPEKAVISVAEGSYTLFGDGRPVSRFKDKALLVFKASGSNINIKNYNKDLGTFAQVKLIQHDPESVFRLKPVTPEMEERRYEGDLTIDAQQSALHMINKVSMFQYVAGVVQSEAGNGHHEEFYKAQAIISRTYALKHFNRYSNRGYNLCDRVNSQVYKTMGYNDTLRSAVMSTMDVVIVDPDINLITAAFHSNSGGSTGNSEDVWSSELPYLRSVEDSFSACMPHYEWEKKIALEEYLNYFNLFTEVNADNPARRRAILNHCPDEPQLYFFPEDSLIPLKSMRTFFDLNSTTFCVDQKQDSVLFVGKGFGHGVGLSQEGAMRMAELGYSHKEILSHYYRNTHLISLSVIDFFRAEN